MASASKSGRRRAREFALQGLYQWLLSGADAVTIEKQLRDASGFAKVDAEYFSALLEGVIGRAGELEESVKPFLDRPVKELSPIERGILLLGGFELGFQPEVPYRVIINEAIELAKTFGGTDGHKYVNGVLDKLALRLRPEETRSRSAG